MYGEQRAAIVDWMEVEGQPVVRCGGCNKPVLYGPVPTKAVYLRCKNSECKKWNRVGGGVGERDA